jgi:hypothetical protein
MKHLAIHLLIALAMFMVGTTAHTLFSVRDDSEVKSRKAAKSRADEENEIKVLVFRDQIASISTYQANTYYLSCYNYADPSDQIMAQLALTAPAHLKKLSELHPVPYASFVNNKIFLRVGWINWINETEVLVGGSCRDEWNNTARSYIYHVVREKGVWRMRSSETIS